MSLLPKVAPAPDPAYGRKVQGRFERVKKNLETYGDNVGTGHKRLSIPKRKMSEDDLRKHLGFVPVTVAIPEAGQKRIQSFRHPDNNYHVHDHGDNWTIHQDRHAASTMMVKKWKMEQAAKKARPATPGAAPGKAPSRLKSLQTSVRNVAKPAGDFVRGAPHVLTEGIPGAYYYAKGRVKRSPTMMARLQPALSSEYKRKVGKWKEYSPAKTAACPGLHSVGQKCMHCGRHILAKAKEIGKSLLPGSKKVAGMPVGPVVRQLKAAVTSPEKQLERSTQDTAGTSPRTGSGAGASHLKVSLPPNPVAQERGRRAHARDAIGMGQQNRRLEAGNAVMSSAKKNMDTGGGPSAGTPGIRRSLETRTALAPQQPKVASMSEAEKARRRHQYYMQHRNELQQKKKAYRNKNKAAIQRKKKRYNMQVSMGARKQRKRIDTGGHSWIYGGFR